MVKAPQGIIGALVARYAARLRFPQLFVFTGTLFLLDMLIPDLILFADELMLGLLTLLLGTWRQAERMKCHGSRPVAASKTTGSMRSR